MNHSKFIFIITLLVISFSGFAQKVKLKKGDVLVDDVLWVKYDGCGGFDSYCSLMDSKGEEELIYIKSVTIEGGSPVTSTNSRGDLMYTEVVLVGTNKKFEIEHKSHKSIVEILYKAKVVKDDKLDAEKVDRLVEKYGTPVSDRLNREANKTIIIKEEPRKSGININIGN